MTVSAPALSESVPLADAAALARVLCDVTRLRLLLALAQGERCVGDLTELLGQPQPTTSHHLALLRGAGLVRARRQGKQICYSLSDRARSDGKVLDVGGEGFRFSIDCAGPLPA